MASQVAALRERGWRRGPRAFDAMQFIDELRERTWIRPALRRLRECPLRKRSENSLYIHYGPISR